MGVSRQESSSLISWWNWQISTKAENGGNYTRDGSSRMFRSSIYQEPYERERRNHSRSSCWVYQSISSRANNSQEMGLQMGRMDWEARGLRIRFWNDWRGSKRIQEDRKKISQALLPRVGTWWQAYILATTQRGNIREKDKILFE